MEKAVALVRSPNNLALLGWVYGVSGRRTRVTEILDELKELSAKSYVSAVHYMFLYNALEDQEAWNLWADRAFEERSSTLVYTEVSPWNDRVRSYSGFENLVRKVGLPALTSSASRGALSK